MNRLLFILTVVIACSLQMQGQSPHGEGLKTDCSVCHDPSGWMPLKKASAFNHDSTNFALEGTHVSVDCKSCHQSLVFSEATNQCNACHTDVHEMSVGNDCSRCHTPQSWIVDKLPELHEEGGFALIGAHSGLSCNDCHRSETNLRFDRIGNDCISCHRTDFASTSNPNHPQAGFSTNCIECHSPISSTWEEENFNHDFFPLTGGHDISDCKECHTSNNFSDASPNCVSCHLTDYKNTSNPDHELGQMSTDCKTCHDVTGWTPSNFTHSTFPLVGSHANVTDCSQCHHGNFASTPNTCEACHMTDYNATTIPDHASSQISTDCKTCHDESAWSPSNFDHSIFPISGAHVAIANDCNQCHHGSFTGTPNTCNACHMPVYNATTNPDHAAAQISTDCKTCHDETAWAPSTFDHSLFPLTGAHAVIANDCNQCHHGTYTGTPNTCDACHMPAYNASTNPDHAAAQISTDCKTCHNESAWIPSSLDHSLFPFVGAHAPIANDCNLCHHGSYTNTPNTCKDCHLTNYNNTSSPDHSASQISTDCRLCHDENGWTPSSLDHSLFPLVAGHAQIANDCNMCHHGNYTNTPNTCEACHMPDYNNTTSPNHLASHMPTDCNQCHDESAWVPSTFTHSTFPLLGAHATITDCNLCHQGNFTNTPNSCDGCHMSDYNGSTNPNHSAAQFPTDCTLCHDETAWVPSGFTHSIYPLIGAHASVSDCNDCHHNNYTTTANTCDGCHMTDYNNSINPNHSTSHFPTDCATCHNETGWTPSNFTHNIFPLLGAHASVADCNDCHHNSYTNTPNTCNGCHMPDYTGSTNPSHTAAQFPTDCAVCHNESAWTPSSFTHNTFPLIGAHTAVADCNDCHHNNYTNTPNTCEACHMADYTASTNPNHSNSHFPTDCATCHTESGWVPSNFTHSTFPLLGAHASVTDCNDCHHNNYTNTPNTCNGCHMPDYTATTNPNHSTAQFATDCATCHTESAWSPASFAHTIFPLIGAHAAISDCNDCHHNNYTNTPNTCNGCHMPDYTATTNPNHSSAQFPTDCAICHNETVWSPSGFTHNSFPLLGAHAAISNCNDCHHNNYTSTPNTCNACHMPDYTATTNPNHSTAQFPTDCAVCHNESAWIPSGFTHSSYPLVGSHASISSCNDCHHGNFTNTPNTCAGCHMPDYNATTNPNHSGSGFSTSCASCHNESGWIPSSFNHDAMYFPIYSGKHNGEWNSCSDCHTNASNYAVFSCINCHEHNNQSNVNGHHNGVSGYSYNSNACYSCHPNGRS